MVVTDWSKRAAGSAALRESLQQYDRKKNTAVSSCQFYMGSALPGQALSESWVHIMTWQGLPNDSTGFWDQYSRELPGLISVPLHVSAGIHTEEELTHFCSDFTHPCLQQSMSALPVT